MKKNGYKTQYYEIMDVNGYKSYDKMLERIKFKHVKVIDYYETDPYWCIPHAYKTKNTALYLGAIETLQRKHDDDVIKKMIKHWAFTIKEQYNEKFIKVYILV